MARSPTEPRTLTCCLRLALLVVLPAVGFVGCSGEPPASVGPVTDIVSTEPTTDTAQSAHPVPPHTIAATPSSDEPPARVPATGKTRDQVTQLERLLNAEHVGWQTEVFNEQAGHQLKKLANAIQSPGNTQDELRDLVDDRFRCVAFRPKNTSVGMQQENLLTEHSRDSNDSEEELVGLDGLQDAIDSLPRPNNNNGDFHVKFKIVGVNLQEGTVETPVYVEGGGDSEHGLVQWRANWKCVWEHANQEMASPLEESPPPRLLSISVDSYEQVTSPKRHRAWFADHTYAVLGREPSYTEQLSQSMDYWTARIEGRLGISRLGHHGLAIGDVNGDGREDLYVCQPGGLPNRLYIAQDDGTARDVAASAGVDYLDDSTCALLVDLDNDGDRDLVVVTVSGAIVLSNDGQARFHPEAILPECSNAFSLTAADYDQDRRPDLFIGRYWPDSVTRGEIAIPVPYYDAENGGRNILLRNKGPKEGDAAKDGWEFEDVTAQVGLDDDNTRFTMAAAWEDIDNDGDPDLYIANDFGRNCLYQNDAGQFTNIAAQSQVEDIASGMSVSFADYDHNGHSDIYISNMFSSAGNRITYQRKYGERFAGDPLAKLQRMARGNSLFQNQSDGKFVDASVSAEVTMGRWAWGSIFTDVNNDGWDDLVVMNGFISTDNTGDL